VPDNQHEIRNCLILKNLLSRKVRKVQTQMASDQQATRLCGRGPAVDLRAPAGQQHVPLRGSARSVDQAAGDGGEVLCEFR
jgi:hypothetical protein